MQLNLIKSEALRQKHEKDTTQFHMPLSPSLVGGAINTVVSNVNK